MLMELTILGTAGGKPSKDRNTSCYVLHIDGDYILFDCGIGALSNLTKSNIPFHKIKKIFISHNHIDHISDLPALLMTMTENRSTRLDIYAPVGLYDFVMSAYQACGFVPIESYYFHDIAKNNSVKTTMYEIQSIEADHTTLAYSFRVNQNKYIGKFNVEKAKALNVPIGPLCGEIQRGNSIEINGDIITPDMILDDMRKGKSFGYSGDTRRNHIIDRFFDEVDCLVYDSTNQTIDLEGAIDRGHSTSFQAARLAKKSNVEKLILTHFSSRYDNWKDALKEARYIHKDTICAKDFMTVSI